MNIEKISYKFWHSHVMEYQVKIKNHVCNSYANGYFLKK